LTFAAKPGKILSIIKIFFNDVIYSIVRFILKGERVNDEPQETFVISDLETLKVVSDPLRVQILELTLDQALTVKQIAQATDLTPSRLYYHINLLEKHGLLEVASTRLVSGIVEKSYRCVAQHIKVEKELFFSSPEGAESLAQAFTTVLDATKADIQKSIQAGLIGPGQPAGERQARMSRSLASLTPAGVQALYQRLAELVDEFDARDEPDGEDARLYALVMGMYPTLQHTEETKHE
jgi:DNA-binding transcriptional ArsR family regulator